MKRILIDYFESTTKYQKLNHIIYPTNTLKKYYMTKGDQILAK